MENNLGLFIFTKKCISNLPFCPICFNMLNINIIQRAILGQNQGKKINLFYSKTFIYICSILLAVVVIVAVNSNNRSFLEH
jgi:hypothetical protein